MSSKTPRVYLSIKEFSALMGIKHVINVRRMLQSGRVVDPDVIVQGEHYRTLGWLPAEAYWFAYDTGRINERGELTGANLRGRPSGQPPEHWRKAPRVYLAAVEVARIMGYASAAVLYDLRLRGGFIPAAVQIGAENPIYGWEEEEVIRFMRQTGRFPPASA